MSNKAHRRRRSANAGSGRRRERARSQPHGWEMEHSPLTFEGRMESIGRFVDGVNRGHRDRETNAFFLVFGGALVFVLLALLVVLLFSL